MEFVSALTAIGIPEQWAQIILLVANLGGLSIALVYGGKVTNWIKRRYLSKDEKEILMQAARNEHRILFKPERSSYPLHIKFSWNEGPFPSQDKEAVMRHVELFEGLIEKSFIRHAENEIYVLTAKGIRAAKRRTSKAAWNWLSSRGRQ